LIESAGHADETRIDRVGHDDPGFNDPIYANLGADEGEATCGLLWSVEETRRGL